MKTWCTPGFWEMSNIRFFWQEITTSGQVAFSWFFEEPHPSAGWVTENDCFIAAWVNHEHIPIRAPRNWITA